jgi:hypothetical protein
VTDEQGSLPAEQAGINQNYHAAKFLNFAFQPLKEFLEVA